MWMCVNGNKGVSVSTIMCFPYMTCIHTLFTLHTVLIHTTQVWASPGTQCRKMGPPQIETAHGPSPAFQTPDPCEIHYHTRGRTHRSKTTQDFVGVMSGWVFGITILLYRDKGVPVAQRPTKRSPSRHFRCGLVRYECWKKSNISIDRRP